MGDKRSTGVAAERNWFRARLEAQLRLALLGDAASATAAARLMNQAQRAGLSGAEIDAAFVGRSFEVRTAALLAFARALKRGDEAEAENKRQQGLRLGLSAGAFDRIAQATDRILRDAR